MADVADHEPGCTLDPVHWLRHAVGAAQRLVSKEPDAEAESVDRLAVVALLDELERRAEFEDDWRTVTLYEVARNATLVGETFAAHCTCKPKSGPATTVRL